ncbi:MAG: hypothetical protein AB1489_00090 [Acidobacteriota bacterium]
MTVLSPTGGKQRSPVQVNWEASDNVGIFSQSVLVSIDGDATFNDTSTIKGDVCSVQVPFSGKVKKAVVRIVSRNAAGNTGSDDSNVFKVKP